MAVIANTSSKKGKSPVSSVLFVSGTDEFSGVDKIADKVLLDVKRVTGALPETFKIRADVDEPASKKAGDDSCCYVVYGTAGKSSLISRLEKAGAVDLKKITGKREVYSFSVVDDIQLLGLKGSAIIIAGSDKRGTIYGLFHLSELMGVSPLVDWAGILPPHKEKIEFTKKDNFVSKEPSVKYRGFFINDEWPAFGNWTMHNYGGFNAKMYEHVFELLLRLKGNYMWPAMWSARFSEDGPGLANAELADELGVIMGASHHEPCCRNGEEYKYLRGKGSIYGDAWNFRANREGITKFWEDGLKRSGKFENVITVGMRGEADTAILGKNATLKDNIDLLRDVLKTQNNLIRKYVNSDEQKVPRMLALYKEVEPYFYGDDKTPGLMGDPELEGVTLMLCDDNHGHLRTVPTDEMRSHKGGYGMYYHLDYHGSPYSYEWANTSSIPEVKEQMCAAYEFGIRELWIVNVGDIFSTEYPLSYFLDLAYDYETYSDKNFDAEQYTKKWAEFQFAALKKSERKEIASLLMRYTKLTRMRRTECLQSDTFHPINFGESDMLLAEAEDIIKRAERLNSVLKKRLVAGKSTAAKEASSCKGCAPGEIPESLYAGFFSQVYFPAAGTMNVLRLQLTAGKNHWYAERGLIAANPLCSKIRKYLAYDKKLVKELDSVDGGRWYAMGWSEHIGFRNWNEEGNQFPVEMRTPGAAKPRILVWLDGDSSISLGQDWTRKTLYLKSFRNPEVNEAVLNIASGSILPMSFEIESDKKWLSFSMKKGEVSQENPLQKIVISINRKQLAKETDKNSAALIKIVSKNKNAPNTVVPIEVDVRGLPGGKFQAGTYIQTCDYISIESEHFIKNVPCGDASFRILPGYGKTLSAIKVFPETSWFSAKTDAPYVEYAFVLDCEGAMNFDFYQSPLNPVSKANVLRFCAEVNGEKIIKDAVPSWFAVGDNQEPWGQDVTNDIRVSTVTASCRKGLNILRVYPVTPSFVLEKIVIHKEDFSMPYSYLGAPETYRLK